VIEDCEKKYIHFVLDCDMILMLLSEWVLKEYVGNEGTLM
jgi:hypothetical protein